MRLHRKYHKRHRYPRSALAAGAFFALAALVWLVAGVPTFVKYPTDLDATPRYEGTFTVLVDAATAAPLAEPMELPLTVERHIESLGEDAEMAGVSSGATRVVVRETIDLRAGDVLAATQVSQYVMDRSTLENVADDRAFAYDPANVVDRSGAYRVNLPFDTAGDRTYPIYQNEIEDTYEMVPDEGPAVTEVEGLDVETFTAEKTEAPLSDTYRETLSELVPLPESLTLDQLKPHLLAAGIDVDAVTAALAPVLTPEDAAAFAEFAGQPIGLEYVMSFTGKAAVEPVTGAQVKVDVTSEAVGVRPQLTSLPALQEILSHYPDVPEAATTSAALDELATAPAIPLFEYSYSQTPSSIAEIADTTRDLRREVLLAKVWLPLGLAAAALLSLAVGLAVFLRRRPRPLDLSSLYDRHPAPRPASEEREPVSSGHRS
jgi:hypothetical protein